MSRWGNFLSGIESGLDKILQDSEPDKSTATSAEKPIEQADVSRTSSNRRRPDRLQERLHKAVEGRSSGESSRPQSTSRPPAARTEKAEVVADGRSSIGQSSDIPKASSVETTASSILVNDTNDASKAETADLEQPQPEINELSQETITEASDSNNVEATNSDTGDHFYLERIEALQARLNLFIQEATERARKEQEDAGADTVAKKAAQQEQRIAELMAEGQKLSEKELKHVGAIRRLHSRANELEASLNKARKTDADAQREIKSLRAKAETADAALKKASAEDDVKAGLMRQLEQTKKQNEAQVKELAGLRSDLERARTDNDLKDQFDKQKQQLEKERRAVNDLREELDNAKIERELSAGRQKSQFEDQRNKASQDRERAVAREAELEGEVKVLESRLETIRTRREEEAGATGDQAKQLRQIEALQRQYAVSKENWGSVEASLNSRISSLEKDRDELAKKETDLRRRLREASSNLRKRDDELDETKASLQELEDKLQSRRNAEEGTINDLKAALKKAQTEANEAQEEIKSLKASLTIQDGDTTPGEKAEDDFSLTARDRFQSPTGVRSRTSAALQADHRDRRQANALGFVPTNGMHSERPPSSRKVSVASPHFPSNASFRGHPFPSLTRSSSKSAFPETSSVDDEREFSDGLRTPATPGRGYDVVSASASNPAAGPSVQLVERMSAAVRRLESEKAATRDELDRMSLERDEARKQMVSLLEEVDAKRSLDTRVAELEKQVSETTDRYQTTLELLGEKAETIEELKADIADMKQIYRDALQKSMK